VHPLTERKPRPHYPVHRLAKVAIANREVCRHGPVAVRSGNSDNPAAAFRGRDQRRFACVLHFHVDLKRPASDKS